MIETVTESPVMQKPLAVQAAEMVGITSKHFRALTEDDNGQLSPSVTSRFWNGKATMPRWREAAVHILAHSALAKLKEAPMPASMEARRDFAVRQAEEALDLHRLETTATVDDYQRAQRVIQRNTTDIIEEAWADIQQEKQRREGGADAH